MKLLDKLYYWLEAREIKRQRAQWFVAPCDMLPEQLKSLSHSKPVFTANDLYQSYIQGALDNCRSQRRPTPIIRTKALEYVKIKMTKSNNKCIMPR